MSDSPSDSPDDTAMMPDDANLAMMPDDASLNDANLNDANLNDANLNGANLNGANLNGASPRDPEMLRSGLTEALDVAQWEWLRPHAKREVVIMVTAAMDLVEVGMAIATDNTASVQRWIDEQAIYKPTQQQLSAWNQVDDLKFEALIVAPFVLVKEPAIA
jgi:hypothetical protein